MFCESWVSAAILLPEYLCCRPCWACPQPGCGLQPDMSSLWVLWGGCQAGLAIAVWGLVCYWL